MASLEARYLSLLKARGILPGNIELPKKRIPKEIFELLLSAAEKGKPSDMDVFRLSSLLRASLEEHSAPLSGTKLGILRRSSLFSAFSELLSAADAALVSGSFKPVASKRRLAFSCISRVRDRDARVFLEKSFRDVFSIPSSKPLRDPSFYIAADRLLDILPVSMARVRFSDLLRIFVFAFLVNLALLFSLSGVAFEEAVKILVLANLSSVYATVSNIRDPGRDEAMPGIYARFDAIISSGAEPKVLDGLMEGVFDSMKASKDPVGWAKSIISLLNAYIGKNRTKEAGEVAGKWVRLLDGYKKPA